METKSILIAGVGGQGTLLASMILGQIAFDEGFDVKLSVVHGMSQRGGSVVTHARYGDKVHSPIVDLGGADVLIAFELLEAERWLPYVKKDGAVLANIQQIMPMPVITGAATYPDDVKEKISSQIENSVFVDALSLAVEAGSPKAVNSVMLGLLAKRLDIEKEVWINAIKKTVKPKFVDMNIVAFNKGYDI